MQNYLEVESNIGLNCKTAKCMAIHPDEQHMIYAIGSLLVLKSVDSEKDRYLQGHAAPITYITVSQ